MTNDDHWMTLKVMAAWMLVTIGHITLSQAATLAAFVLSVLHIYFLLRDKWWRERKKDRP